MQNGRLAASKPRIYSAERLTVGTTHRRCRPLKHNTVEPKMTQEAATPDYDSLVLDDRVHTSLYTDPAIFEAEMDKIFNNTWLRVAHASEISAAANFKMSHVR